MSDARFPKSLFLVIFVAALADSIRGFSLLPDRVASHFNAIGAPNGWMTKPQFIALYGAVIVLATAVGFLPPLLVANISPALINLPNKDYWLAPERRGETLVFFQKQFAWFGCAFLLLLVSAMHLVIEGNLQPAPQLSTGAFLFFVYAFILFTLLWSIAMFRKFSNTG